MIENKSGSIFFVPLFFVLLLLAAMYLFFDQKIDSRDLSPSSTPSSNSTSVPDLPLAVLPQDVDPIYQEVKDFFNSNTDFDSIEVANDGYVWWVSEDGYNIINYDELSLESHLYCDNPKSEKFDALRDTVATMFANVMFKNGFEKNILNSSSSVTDEKYYDYIEAYEKNGLKCTIVANPDCFASSRTEIPSKQISFTCTPNYSSNYTEQIPFLRDLNIKNAVISISQIENYASLNIHHRRTGQYMIAVMEDGHWKSLYSGQDIPSCEVMDKYSVPEELYGGVCY